MQNEIFKGIIKINKGYELIRYCDKFLTAEQVKIALKNYKGPHILKNLERIINHDK